MSFRDILNADLNNVFFNITEFSEAHTINGIEMNAIIDEDSSKIRSENKERQYDGVYLDETVIYAKASDFEERPVNGEQMNVDGKVYYVSKCTENAGVLEITLEANES